jgi:hypothetical protein
MDIGKCVPETNETNNCLGNSCPGGDCRRVTVHDPVRDVSVWQELDRKRYTDLKLQTYTTGPLPFGPCNEVPINNQSTPGPVCTGIKAVVTNVGEGPVTGIRAPLYMHRFGFPIGIPFDLGDPLVFNLPNPGDKQEVNYYWWLPVSGDYYLDVIVTATQPEINTNNNNTQRQIPDLELEDIKVGK